MAQPFVCGVLVLALCVGVSDSLPPLALLPLLSNDVQTARRVGHSRETLASIEPAQSRQIKLGTGTNRIKSSSAPSAGDSLPAKKSEVWPKLDSQHLHFSGSNLML